MRIRCVSCGHNFELSNAYDNYEGDIKCWVCGATLEIKMHEGMLKYSRCAKPHSMAEDTFDC